MGRPTDFRGFHPRRTRVDNDNNNRLLKINSFYVRLSGLKPHELHATRYLTLLYLPTINEEAELCVEGSKVRPHATAFLELHRVMIAKTVEREAIFGSRKRVRVSDGARFEVYLGRECILDGSYGKDDKGDWRLHCKCGMESAAVAIDGADVVVEVGVEVEGKQALSERVEMVAKKKSGKKGRTRAFNNGMETIPEDREDDDADGKLDGVCSCECGGYGSDGGDWEEACGPDCTRNMEMDLEGLRRAIDVGTWILSLGMGLFLSKAFSSN